MELKIKLGTHFTADPFVSVYKVQKSFKKRNHSCVSHIARFWKKRHQEFIPISSISLTMLTVAPFSLDWVSSNVEAGWGESAVITIALSLLQEPTIRAPNSVLICHCPRINFCCTIFVNYVCVFTILTTFSLKIIPQLNVKISKSHVSIIPMANLESFELNSVKFDAKLTKMVRIFLITHLILKSY